jgi:hypothetical protein
MVKYSGRKKAARAHAQATGMSYTAAERRTSHRGGGPLSALGVHTGLMNALEAAGWPVEYQTFPENGEYTGFAGPACMNVGRNDQLRSWSGDEDPDDESLVDLSLPPRIGMSAPVAPEGPVEVDGAVSGDRPVAEVIAELGRMISEGRARGLAAAASSASCAICSDAYPEPHLLASAGQRSGPVCPACAFDGDLYAASDDASEYLAYQIDRLTFEDLAAPAGWAGPAALLACTARTGFGDRLERAWRGAGDLNVPARSWSQPDQLWVWLPPGDRPAPLNRFGPGARLGAIVTALDEHFPDLRQRARERGAEGWREAGAGEDEQIPDHVLDPVWPAAVAYAISFRTQVLDRPSQRQHAEDVFDSLDTLRDHLDLVESTLDFYAVEMTVILGIEVVTEALWGDATKPGDPRERSRPTGYVEAAAPGERS